MIGTRVCEPPNVRPAPACTAPGRAVSSLLQALEVTTMTTAPASVRDGEPDDTSDIISNWPAVLSLAMGIFGLVVAEYLPASLLTPMADALAISEGQAGQAVTATAGVALLSGLIVPSLLRRTDRRLILLAFTTLLILSNVLAAMAESLRVLLTARVLLGVALGGFWALAAALSMRLVREEHVPRALSLIFSGVPVALISGAAAGSFLGELFGWRAVFLIAAGCGIAALLVQAMTLPTLVPTRPTPLSTVFRLLTRQGIGAGILAVVMVFTGHFILFTYIRPFLETVSGADIIRISTTLLIFGVANLVGTLLAGLLLAGNLRLTLSAMPAVIALVALGLVTLGGSSAMFDTGLIAIWGLAFGAVPVGWSTWITRTVPDEAEGAGGLLGASVQGAITIGAAAGGWLYDVRGLTAAFMAAAVILAAAVVIIGRRVRT